MDRNDLTMIGNVFGHASGVRPMCELYEYEKRGHKPPADLVFLRHDVDGNNDSLNSSLAMARWEHERGYQSTYYFLHHTAYWRSGQVFERALREIASLGHEIGFHNNALAVARRTKSDPFHILHDELTNLRKWSGQPVLGTAAHGDADCTTGGFVNYQVFSESVSPHVLKNYMSPEEIGIVPRPLSDFGLTHQGDWLKRPHYVTDSGGTWGNYKHHDFVHTLVEAAAQFPYPSGHLVILQHPDWWPVVLYS